MSETDVLFLKHDSSILRQSSNPVCGFSMMEQARLCAVWPTERELSWLFHEPHTGLDDFCLRVLLSCFRERTLERRNPKFLMAEGEQKHHFRAAVECLGIDVMQDLTWAQSTCGWGGGVRQTAWLTHTGEDLYRRRRCRRMQGEARRPSTTQKSLNLLSVGKQCSAKHRAMDRPNVWISTLWGGDLL